MRGTRAKGASDPNSPFFVSLRDAERQILRDAIAYCGGNVSAAAEMLGVSHTLVEKRVKILGGILPDDPRREPFEYQKALREKRRHQRATATARDHDQDQPADAPDGAPGSADHEQDRTDDRGTVEV